MAIIKKVKDAPGPPIRASLAVVKKEIGYRWWFEKHLHKLPQTTEMVAKCIETFEAYLIRKAKWIENLCIQRGEIPTRYRFMRRVSNSRSASIPTVQSAVDAAMVRLSQRNNVD